jgi:hypothetical protein
VPRQASTWVDPFPAMLTLHRYEAILTLFYTLARRARLYWKWLDIQRQVRIGIRHHSVRDWPQTVDSRPIGPEKQLNASADN